MPLNAKRVAAIAVFGWQAKEVVRKCPRFKKKKPGYLDFAVWERKRRYLIAAI